MAGPHSRAGRRRPNAGPSEARAGIAEAWLPPGAAQAGDSPAKRVASAGRFSAARWSTAVTMQGRAATKASLTVARWRPPAPRPFDRATLLPAPAKRQPEHYAASQAFWRSTLSKFGQGITTVRRSEVRFRGQTGKHLLVLSVTGFDPKRSFRPHDLRWKRGIIPPLH
jgi:hypothetical protein